VPVEMSVFWLNYNYVDSGVWTNSPTGGLSRGVGVVQQVGGADIQILEVKFSGGATLAVAGDPSATLATSGGPSVALFIKYTSGREEFRSGPSDLPYALQQVEEFSFFFDVVVGNRAYEQVEYAIEVVGHVQWAGPSSLNPPPVAQWARPSSLNLPPVA
jgi:hypothetical protein